MTRIFDFARSNRSGWIVSFLIGLALIAGLPMFLDLFALLQVTLYAIFALLALSLGFVIGFGGILCLGQSAFFGLGAYTYVIAVGNMGESTMPALLSVVIPGMFAAGLGYFMFYGRISEVYVGAITLTVALILYSVANSTADPKYAIGAVRIGGFNGIPNVSGINRPFSPDVPLEPIEMFYLCTATLLACYLGLRRLLSSQFGRVAVAVRENERRAELIGFDIRLIKLQVFTIGAAIAGLAGCLFASWGSFVAPTAFSIVQSAEILIWVLVGGIGTLIGPIVGAVILSWLINLLGLQHTLNTNLVLGAILLVFVLAIPNGLIPSANKAFEELERRWKLARRPGRASDND